MKPAVHMICLGLATQRNVCKKCEITINEGEGKEKVQVT